MKTPDTYITMAHMLDYVTKLEFNEFKGEMRDFRKDTNERFDKIDRTMDQMRDENRRNMGVLFEQFRHELQLGFELMNK